MLNLDKNGSPEPSLEGGCTCPKFKAAENRLLLLLGANASGVPAVWPEARYLNAPCLNLCVSAMDNNGTCVTELRREFYGYLKPCLKHRKHLKC